jgi:hypothetical protein
MDSSKRGVWSVTCGCRIYLPTNLILMKTNGPMNRMIVHLEKSRLHKFSPDLFVTQKSVHSSPSLKHPLRPSLFYYHVIRYKTLQLQVKHSIKVGNYVTSLAACACLSATCRILSILRLTAVDRAFACPYFMWCVGLCNSSRWCNAIRVRQSPCVKRWQTWLTFRVAS